MSRLSDQSKVLAQRQAILEQQLRRLERARAQGESVPDDGIETLLRSSGDRGS